MALFSTDDIHRITLPSDLPHVTEGDWIDISVVYTAAMRRRIGRRAQQPDPVNPSTSSFDYPAWKQALLEEIIRAWSDKEPVSPDSIGQLHPFVMDFIATEFDRLSAGRTNDEKKESEPSSLAGAGLGAVGSPTNSSI